ncbi:MAG TPA: glycosyltransferase family 39 protein [Luteimonas sp.]|nr:glycosyltransferase family 39 protein [Luteimonas sp.]
MRALLRSPTAWIAALAIVLALLFLGSRGIWDPDEGRYTNVALHMLDSGDWVDPRRSAEVNHWTKPPLTYWAIASSVAVFGHNAWAARLPAALSYLLCVWLAWRIARRLAPGSEAQAALIYATMLLPFGAAQMITTDYVLAACETLALWGFVEARFGGHARKRWLALMWAGFALAFLAKGPPGLLPLLAVLAFDVLTPGRVRPRALQWSGLLLFVLIALPWYAAVMLRNPGLFDYFLGNEVVDRFATNDFARHGEWYGWIAIYLPTLLIGTLPWTPALLRWARSLPASVRSWRTSSHRAADGAGLLLALWLLLPLLVFCISRSRLPLYILPLFVPLAVLAARQRMHEGKPLPRWRWLLLWAVCLLALKFATSLWPTHKDARAWAEAIHARAPGAISQVEIVEDMARYGLHLHLGTQVEKLSLEAIAQPRFNPEYDANVSVALGDNFDPDAIWITKEGDFARVRARLQVLGYMAIVQGAPYQGRVIFRARRQGAHP